MYFLIILLVILLIILLIISWKIWGKRKIDSKNLNKSTDYKLKRTYRCPISPTVIIYKTHVWNYSIEKFVRKIRSEAEDYGIDLFILLQKDSSQKLEYLKDTSLKNNIIMFSEAEIKNVYVEGYFNLWLCNHWILMWFFKKYPNYSYYWSIEYDVRISGDSSKIWAYNGSEDFIYPVQEFQHSDWAWKNHYVGHQFNDNNKWYGYLQLTRYSKRFLIYLDKHFTNNENGQDEMIIFSLFKKGVNEIGLTGNFSILNNLIQDSWSVDNTTSKKHKKLFNSSKKEYKKNDDHLLILHPIK